MEARDPIGFVIALPLECRSLTRQKVKRLDTLYLDSGRMIRVSGAGAANAGAAADELIARGARRLVSWGCAGALTNELVPGDLVVPQEMTASDGTRSRFCDEWRARLTRRLDSTLNVHVGTITESTTVIDSSTEKRRMNATTGAIAVDMESAAVLRTAVRYKVPCIAVRAIADDQSTAMPRTVLDALDEQGEVRLASLLLGLARRPLDLFALLHLNRCFNAALLSLTRVARSAGPGLAA